MADAKSLTVRLLLQDGDAEGPVRIRSSEWQEGEAVIGNRIYAQRIANEKYHGGAYILFSQLMCAVFPLEELTEKLQQHTEQEKWWSTIAVISKQSSDMSHEESIELVEILKNKAKEKKSLRYEDETEQVYNDDFTKAFLEKFVVEAIDLLDLVGLKVLKDHNRLTKVEVIEGIKLEKTQKWNRYNSPDYIKSNGVHISNCHNFATKGKGEEYWINADPNSVHTDWSIILNDEDISELIIADIPAFSLETSTSKRLGLLIRRDNNSIDLSIDAASFVDRKSGIDFSPYLTKRIKYAGQPEQTQE